MKISNSEEKFKPTVEWMAKKYDEINAWLFNGKLGSCNFEIYSSGYNSLGHFRLGNSYLKMKKDNRRIFTNTSMYGISYAYVNRDDFDRICKPIIGLNGNYKGTEKAWVSTLIHEMCHYYTYMHGYVPKQAHGPEFRQIAEAVAVRSNGMFTIQRLAQAEEMKDYELDSDIAAKAAKRKANQIRLLNAVFGFMPDGSVKLLTSTHLKVLQQAVKYFEQAADKVVVSKDPELINILYAKGYRTNVRTLSFYNFDEKDITNSLEKNYNVTVIDKKSNDMDTVNTNTTSPVKINEEDIRHMVREALLQVIKGEDGVPDDGNSISITPDMDLGKGTPMDYAK